MTEEDVEVVPATVPVVRGGVPVLTACDPTYVVGIADRAKRESLGPMPLPAENVAWGEITRGSERPAGPVLLPSLPPEADGETMSAKLPASFEPVEHVDLELDLAVAEPNPEAVPSVAPSVAAAPGDAAVVVESRFWERVPLAFVAPLLGRAWVLLLVAAVVPAGAAVLLSFDVGLVTRVVVAVVTLVFSLGLLTEAFARVAQEGADNDEGTPSPSLGDSSLRSVLGSGVANAFAGGLLFVLPAYFFVSGEISRELFVALSFVPYFYWPMALAVQGLTGEVMAGFDVPLVLRAMFTAPMKYITVVALGFALTTALSVAAYFAVFALAQMAGPSRLLVFGGTLCFFGALTYLHGVLGYAMGRLAASEDKLSQLLVGR